MPPKPPILPKGFVPLVEPVLPVVPVCDVPVFEVEVDYFSDSGFLITACIDSPSVNPKVDNYVSSLRIFPCLN